MRKLLAISTLILCFTICHGQDTVPHYAASVDIGAAITRKALHISIGRRLAGHWSVHGEHETVLTKVGGAIKQEQTEHYNQFLEDEGTQDSKTANKMVAGLKIKYWPRETFKGGFIMTGFRHGNRTGADFIAGTGYSFTIWKGLKCSLSYEGTLERNPDKVVRLTLNYIY